MTQPSAYALLAGASYSDIRILADNKAPIPTGWTELTAYAVNGSGGGTGLGGSGFSAKVYRSSAGEIVISYAGTEFAASMGSLADFTNGNVPLAQGKFSRQALEAAALYERVKAAEGGNITFTGHSLGGGLASVMAVWFNRPAYVFAPAPFEAAATRTDVLSALYIVRGGLRDSALGCDAELDSYDPATQFAVRESKVQAWAVKGEVLESTLGMFNWIEAGSGNKLVDAGATELGMLPKHSIDLHAAALLSPAFNEWAAKLTTALPRVFDSKLYGFNPLGNDRDFLIKLNRNEVGVPGLAANGMLTHFGNDLQKLGTNIAGLNKAAQDALIAQGLW